jgi:hypothetical protein
VFLNKCYFYCTLSWRAEFPNYPKYCLSEIGSAHFISDNRGSTVFATCVYSVMHITVAVFWDVTPCRLVDRYDVSVETIFYTLEVIVVDFSETLLFRLCNSLILVHVDTSQKVVILIFIDVKSSDFMWFAVPC